jgi:hypothetical protein
LDLAYTRELSEALGQLETDFSRWRAGESDAFELDEQIHKHHQGPSRKIWKLYASASDWELALPGALYRGALSIEDFPNDLWDAIGLRIEEIKKGLFEHA